MLGVVLNLAHIILELVDYIMYRFLPKGSAPQPQE